MEAIGQITDGKGFIRNSNIVLKGDSYEYLGYLETAKGAFRLHSYHGYRGYCSRVVQLVDTYVLVLVSSDSCK